MAVGSAMAPLSTKMSLTSTWFLAAGCQRRTKSALTSAKFVVGLGSISLLQHFDARSGG